MSGELKKIYDERVLAHWTKCPARANLLLMKWQWTHGQTLMSCRNHLHTTLHLIVSKTFKYEILNGFQKHVLQRNWYWPDFFQWKLSCKNQKCPAKPAAFTGQNVFVLPGMIGLVTTIYCCKSRMPAFGLRQVVTFKWYTKTWFSRQHLLLYNMYKEVHFNHCTSSRLHYAYCILAAFMEIFYLLVHETCKLIWYIVSGIFPGIWMSMCIHHHNIMIMGIFNTGNLEPVKRFVYISNKHLPWIIHTSDDFALFLITCLSICISYI